MIDLNELKKLAEAATPGPWERDTIRSDGEYGTDDDGGFGFDTYEVTDNTGQCIMDCTNNDNGCVEVGHDGHAWDEVAKHNAAFVAAANPAVILELIALASAAQDSAPAELPPLPKTVHVVRDGLGDIAFYAYSPEEMQAYGAACAAAALPRPVVSIPEGWNLVPSKITEAMHVAAVKAVIQSTGNDDCPPNVWRAMLAAAPASPQPVAKVLTDEDKWHSLTCDGTCSPPCKDAPLPPAFEVGILSDDQLNYIARQYFAEEWAQNHLKNAIHDAFRAASTPTTLTEKKE